MGFAFCRDGICCAVLKLQNHPPSCPDIPLGCPDAASLKTKPLCSPSLRTKLHHALVRTQLSLKAQGYPTSPVGFSCPRKAGRHLSNVNIPMEILHSLGWKKPFGCFLTSFRQCLTLLRPDGSWFKDFHFQKDSSASGWNTSAPLPHSTAEMCYFRQKPQNAMKLATLLEFINSFIYIYIQQS